MVINTNGEITNIYDIRLFDFDNKNITVFNNENDINYNYNYFIKLLHHGTSTSPYFIYKFLKKYIDITFEEIIDNY
jgi:hypothetical protein